MAEDRKFKFEDGRFINRVSGEEIPDDEPVIIFRARDRHAVGLLLTYQNMVENDHHKAAIQDRINEFTQFQIDHSERMKEPGITGDIRLNPDQALAAFGAITFDELFGRFCDGEWEVEFHDFITKEAVKRGLVEQTTYNPEIHDSDDCMPGDPYYVITTLGRAARDRAKELRR